LFIVFWITRYQNHIWRSCYPDADFQIFLLTPSFSQDTTSEYSDLTNPTKIMSTDQYIS
jgi:hypothetical protein